MLSILLSFLKEVLVSSGCETARNHQRQRVRHNLNRTRQLSGELSIDLQENRPLARIDLLTSDLACREAGEGGHIRLWRYEDSPSVVKISQRISRVKTVNVELIGKEVGFPNHPDRPVVLRPRDAHECCLMAVSVRINIK